MRKKVTVVGSGNVGATAAHWMAAKEHCDVVLIDIIEGVPQGKALDLLQAMPIEKRDSYILGTNDYADTANSDIVVITAGIPRKPGMSRDDLLNTNFKIMSDVVGKAVQYSPNSILIIVSNPLDAMAQAAYKLSGFSRNRVIGMAGILDSARFRTFIARELDVSIENVTAFVLGGHGDTMVPLPRYSTVAGIPITELMDKATIERLVQRTRDGGAEIVKHLKTGSAYYAPSLGRHRDGGGHSEGQEEDRAVCRLSGRRVRHQRAVRRRALQAGLQRHRADPRDQADAGGAGRPAKERRLGEGTGRRDRGVALGSIRQPIESVHWSRHLHAG